MVAVSVDVDTKELEVEFAHLVNEYGEATVKGAITGAHLVRGDAIKSIQSESMGTFVTRYTANTNAPYEHIAAKPGAAPNTDTGFLVNSIHVEAEGGGLFGVRGKGVFVGTRLIYGSWLENGTKKMLPRPWLWPALLKNRTAIKKLIGKEVDSITSEWNAKK